MLFALPDILIILLISQLIFISIYLFTKTVGKPVSNKLLGSFFLSIGVSMADALMLRTGVWYRYPNAATLGSAIPFLYGPLLFLYTQSLIYKTFSFKKKFVHFLPFLLISIASVAFYEIQPKPLKIHLLQAIGTHQVPASFYFAALLMILHFCIYAAMALLLIRKYKAVSLNKFSSVQQINLDWLSSTIIFFLGLFVLSLINNIFEVSSLAFFYPITLMGIIILLFYFINRVIFKALHNPDYFSWMEAGEAPVNLKTAIKVDLPERTNEIDSLLNFMIKNKPYLNSSLTIDILAKSLKVHPKELSKLINENLQQNFFDFVNRYRITEAQGLLRNNPDKKTTVLEILYQSGFNSKSSFNTLFKKYTGSTPTEFKNQQI